MKKLLRCIVSLFEEIPSYDTEDGINFFGYFSSERTFEIFTKEEIDMIVGLRESRREVVNLKEQIGNLIGEITKEREYYKEVLPRYRETLKKL